MNSTSCIGTLLLIGRLGKGDKIRITQTIGNTVLVDVVAVKTPTTVNFLPSITVVLLDNEAIDGTTEVGVIFRNLGSKRFLGTFPIPVKKTTNHSRVTDDPADLTGIPRTSERTRTYDKTGMIIQVEGQNDASVKIRILPKITRKRIIMFITKIIPPMPTDHTTGMTVPFGARVARVKIGLNSDTSHNRHNWFLLDG